MNTTEEIRTIINNWVAAIQQKNIPGILDNHTQDVLMFDVPMPLQSKGLTEYQKTWELFFQYSRGGKDTFNLEELQIYAGDKVAFCTALIRLANNSKPQCRLTLGLRKINNRWMIAHEHHSAPHEIQ